jgi:geranylgeranyl diphosphate synthase type II
MADIYKYLDERRTIVDRALDESLPPIGTRPGALHEAMRYCVLNGGKRIRPILSIAAAEAFGLQAAEVLKPAIAVELFHCSTLIHDDLPCMDDDDMRRGMPTCHVKFGEANAVLAGDALMIHAFQMLAEYGDSSLSLELALAAGSQGVIAGQVEDLEAEQQQPNADLVEFIHYNKTAILIRAAVRIGAIAAGGEGNMLKQLSSYGAAIGLAFQIQDDVLDETSSDEVLGKHAGADLAHQKMTYPAVHGMEASQKKIRELTDDAIAAIEPLSLKTERLRSIAEHLVKREF